MDLAIIFAYVRVVLNELWARKFLVFLMGAAISLTILVIGTQWRVTYETSMMIYADNENILKPLLARQAEITKVQDQVRVVRDVMMSPRLLRKTVSKLNPMMDDMEVEQQVKTIRGNLRIKGLGGGHVSISYQGSSPDTTFDTLNTVTDLFIRDNSASQRNESREAFEFIDKQVAQYKDQLLSAENKLKEFRSQNFDGTVGSVTRRINDLRSSIESMKLDVEEASSRITLIKGQLAEENRFSAKTYKADIYRQRLAALQAKKDALLLQYQESYPDVVSVTLQINDMKEAIRDAESSQAVEANGDQDQSFNPIYEELRSKLAEAELDADAKIRRLKSTQILLDQEFERRKRIATREAELSELTRDYDVTRKIYEDMLERKEKARLSMSLSIEGQGVTYKIQEPPVYPTRPTGLRFVHFVLIGLFLGTTAPLGLIAGIVLVDPRIRLLSQLTNAVDVPVLADISHTTTPFTRRMVKTDALILVFLIVMFLAVYATVSIGYQSGWLKTFVQSLLGS